MSCPLDVAVSFVRMLWPVPEDNGTVFVCVNISNGIARDVLIAVNASKKDVSNAATGKLKRRHCLKALFKCMHGSICLLKNHPCSF